MHLDVCVLGVSLTISTGSGTAERRRCHSNQSAVTWGPLLSAACRRCGGGCGTVVGPSRPVEDTWDIAGNTTSSDSGALVEAERCHGEGGAWARPLDVIRLE